VATLHQRDPWTLALPYSDEMGIMKAIIGYMRGKWSDRPACHVVLDANENVVEGELGRVEIPLGGMATGRKWMLSFCITPVRRPILG
jgi:hypothetical protein